MSTRMQGKITSGPGPSPDTAAGGEGAVLMRQVKDIDFDATLVQNATFNIPLGSDIVDILVDPITPFNSLTSATVSVGSASGGTQYASGADGKAVTRVRPAFTNAQLAAHKGLTNSTVVATVTSVGQPGAGKVRVTILYEQGAN